MMTYAKCVVKAKSFVPKKNSSLDLTRMTILKLPIVNLLPLLIALKAHRNLSSFSVIYIILIVEKVISLNIGRMSRYVTDFISDNFAKLISLLHL